MFGAYYYRVENCIIACYKQTNKSNKTNWNKNKFKTLFIYLFETQFETQLCTKKPKKNTILALEELAYFWKEFYDQRG